MGRPIFAAAARRRLHSVAQRNHIALSPDLPAQHTKPPTRHAFLLVKRHEFPGAEPTPGKRPSTPEGLESLDVALPLYTSSSANADPLFRTIRYGAVRRACERAPDWKDAKRRSGRAWGEGPGGTTLSVPVRRGSPGLNERDYVSGRDRPAERSDAATHPAEGHSALRTGGAASDFGPKVVLTAERGPAPCPSVASGRCPVDRKVITQVVATGEHALRSLANVAAVFVGAGRGGREVTYEAPRTDIGDLYDM